MIRHHSKITQADQKKQNIIQIQSSSQQTHPQWNQIKIPSNIIHPRSFHATALYKNKVYVYGGYETGVIGILDDFLCFDLQNNEWEKLSKSQLPGRRHSHSLVVYKDSLFLYGGVINTLQSDNLLFEYDLILKKWTQRQQKGCIPLKVNSHRSLVIQDKMILIGGLSEGVQIDKIYELDLKTFQWKIKIQLKGQSPKTRVDFSVSLYGQKIYIFGGRSSESIYNQLWVYNYKLNQFKQLNLKKFFVPKQRYKHGSVCYKQKLFIFGGTTGITHQRNDLVVFDFQKQVWSRHWEDSQSQKKLEKQQIDETGSKCIKKTAQNSTLSKMTTSSFCPSSLKQKSWIYEKQNNKKYRRAIKQVNYYNDQYPCFLDSKYHHPNKAKKNDLIVNLQKQCSKEIVQIQLSQTFQSLNQSVLNHMIQTNGKLQTPSNQEYQKKKIYPKSRDGHSCTLVQNQMIVFGGDRHLMSYNDLVRVNLDLVIQKLQSKT